MKRPKKYRLSQPDRQTAPPSPPEVVELFPRGGKPAGKPVTPLPGSPAPELIELYPRGPKPDPNRPLVPTEAEVATLPRWARMAFASRCARRLLPLVAAEPTIVPQQRRAVVALVEAAEQSAAAAALQSRPLATAVREVKASRADFGGLGNEAATAALAAAHALGCDAARAAVNTLQRLATVRTLRFVLSPRRDYERLSRLAKEQNWTDDTPVSPEVFGPMWDRDPPPWWRDDALEGLTSEGTDEKPK